VAFKKLKNVKKLELMVGSSNLKFEALELEA
jgi:hypothetical protein